MVELPNLRKGDSKMKFRKLLTAAAAVSFAIAGTSTFADPPADYLADHPNSAELMVKTEIKKACYLDAVGMVDFGEIYPGWKGESMKHKNNSKVKFRCTKGTAYEVKFDVGESYDGYTRYMKHLEPGDMPAEMTQIPYWLINGSNDNEADDDSDELGTDGIYGQSHHGEGLGLSTTEELIVKGVIYESDLADVLPGSYKDTVTVTLCF